jgi:hypothetical protein
MVHNLISKCDSERIALEAGNCPNDRPMRAKDVGSCLPECPVLTLRGGTGFYALTVFRTPRAHAALICYFRCGLTAAVRCACRSKILSRSPESPLFSSCPIQFAPAANFRFPPFVSIVMDGPELPLAMGRPAAVQLPQSGHRRRSAAISGCDDGYEGRTNRLSRTDCQRGPIQT